MVLVVKKGVGGQTQCLKELQHYYIYVFLEGAAFTKLCRTQNNYGAQRQKWKEWCWQPLQTCLRVTCLPWYWFFRQPKTPKRKMWLSWICEGRSHTGALLNRHHVTVLLLLFLHSFYVKNSLIFRWLCQNMFVSYKMFYSKSFQMWNKQDRWYLQKCVHTLFHKCKCLIGISKKWTDIFH